MTAAPKLGFTWQLGEGHGWGLVGVHTALLLIERGTAPLLLERPALATVRPENRARLQGLEADYAQIEALVRERPGQRFVLPGADIVHVTGNHFLAGPASARFTGKRDIALVAFEDTTFTPEVLARARSYERIITISTYNRDFLLERGLPRVGLAIQGVDPGEMAPRPATGRLGDRFVVFSGGKLEFRKGQDIALAAFRVFHQRHADAVLLTNWFNAWPASAATIAQSTLAPAPLRVDEDGRVGISDWALANGVPAEAFVDLGFLPRDQIAAIFAECHAAIFPNRCEAGTNLVAMEAIACEVPVVLSANTGHLDLIGELNRVEPTCLTLTRQDSPLGPADARIGWGESSVEELVEHLETLYADRALARARAAKAGALLRAKWTWRRFAETFIDEIGEGDA